MFVIYVGAPIELVKKFGYMMHNAVLRVFLFVNVCKGVCVCVFGYGCVLYLCACVWVWVWVSVCLCVCVGVWVCG